MNILSFLKQNSLSFVAVMLFCVLAFLAHRVSNANQDFRHAYLEYAALADDADQAIYIPTATNNPVRAQINLTLVQILGNKLTNAGRLSEAMHGIALVKGAKEQLDAITPKIDAVQDAIVTMEQAEQPGDSFFQKGEPEKIIALCHERQAAVKDIQALSYRANFETEKIFQHIVDAKGELSSKYVQDLNNQLPAVQDDFDRRLNRYSDLQAAFDNIQAAYADFATIL